jgi:predicted nuclease of restriction endonuclease-like (RecB) superfamily
MKTKLVSQGNTDYQNLIASISTTYVEGQRTSIQTARHEMLITYWKIGQHIVEFEQGGQSKAVFGIKLIEQISKDLSHQLGRGFSRSNLIYMRLCYLKYSDVSLLSHQLTWGHYFELLKIDMDLERSFYEKQAILDKWNVRELKRQKKSALFLRLATSQDKEGVLKLAREGRVIENPMDILRDPYMLEFLKVPEPYHLEEADLESRLITHLQSFLLELGKGFAFIGRQYRVTLGNRHYRVDLVFYHRILKCFVLIDLKKDEASYDDIGQMNMYLGYFEEEENTEGDNPPIGIVLAREKDEMVVRYATHRMTSQLFVTKYQLYLPNEEELRTQLEYILNLPEEEKGIIGKI